MAEGGGGTSSFYERSSGSVKNPSIVSSGDPGTLDGSFLLQILQGKSQGTSSSSSNPLLPHKAHRPYDDPAVTAIGPGFPLLPHSLLSQPQHIPGPTQPGVNYGESISFSPPSWATLPFSPPEASNRHLQEGQHFFNKDHHGLGFPPNGVSPNSTSLNSNFQRISQNSSHDGVLASKQIGNIGGKKVSGYQGRDEMASMKPPPGFGKSLFDGSAEFKRKPEGGAMSQIGSNRPNQQWRSHISPDWRTSDIDGGLKSTINMMQGLNLQNNVVKRHDLKQNPEKILDSDAMYRRQNGYTNYKEKHVFSASSGAPNLSNSYSMQENDGGEFDNNLGDNDFDDQGNQTLEKVAHNELGKLLSTNSTHSEEDLLGKNLPKYFTEILEFTKVIKESKILRTKDFRLDDTRGQRVSSQRFRIRRRELRRRHDINNFSSCFLRIFKSLTPSAGEIIKQEQLLLSLKKLVNKEWPDAELHLYGSCANSFGVSNSDIDLCLVIKDYEISKLDILLKLADILESSNLQNVKALTRARVPIVKMKDPVTGLSCDICINNLLAVVNTKLLKDYAQIDERLRQLAFIVKHWAKSRRVNEAYQGTLSSYAYVLMCIHFLQTREPAILPCLQGMTVTYKVVVDDTECAYFDQVEKLHNFGARNNESIAQLIWAFFHYWAYHHDYMNDVISVRTGSIISKHAKDWTRRIGNDRHLICIEDPFEVSHDLGRVVDKFSIKILREEFERAAEILQNDPNPTVTLFEPYILASSVESNEPALAQA